MSQIVRGITTSQTEPHEKLLQYVERYRNSKRLRPVSGHTQTAFDECVSWLNGWQGHVIFDSCCGVGESTAVIAAQFPDAKVIGIDKSAARLAKHGHYQNDLNNYRIVRADVNDFWFLARQHGLQLSQHFLLYPNPYPKPSQVQKRWHAGPAMPDFVSLGGQLHIRSNWKILVQEFQMALSVYGIDSDISAVNSGPPLTPFERKYCGAGQQCWQLQSNE